MTLAERRLLAGTRPVLLPLDAARLCLDCDLLTDSSVCPGCAGGPTALVSRWLRPLDGPASPDPLRQSRHGAPVDVISDRRAIERRREGAGTRRERPRGDRRTQHPAGALYARAAARDGSVASAGPPGVP